MDWEFSHRCMYYHLFTTNLLSQYCYPILQRRKGRSGKIGGTRKQLFTRANTRDLIINGPDLRLEYPGELRTYLPAAIVGENLVVGQVQLVPLQQQLQLPVPVVLLVGAKGYKKTAESTTKSPEIKGPEPFRMTHYQSHFPRGFQACSSRSRHSQLSFRFIFTHSYQYSECPKV